MIMVMTDIELEVATQTLIDFVRERNDIYGRFTQRELGTVLGNVMFVFGESYDAWLKARDYDEDTISDMVNEGKGIYTDNE